MNYKFKYGDKVKVQGTFFDGQPGIIIDCTITGERHPDKVRCLHFYTVQLKYGPEKFAETILNILNEHDEVIE